MNFQQHIRLVCVACATEDGRTKAGGLFCHDCDALSVHDRRALSLERLNPSQEIEGYERRRAA